MTDQSGEALPRRDFLSQATLAAVGAVLSACSGGSPTSPTNPNGDPGPGTAGGTLVVTLSTFPSLGSVGGIAAVGTIAGRPIAVVRASQTSYVPLSRICTHAACTVDVASGGFACPCHGSRYNAQGSVTNGPAQQSLQRFHADLSADGASITIS